MSNPQLENGYTKLANELLDQVCLYPLSGRELRVALFVIRKTYGFNKKHDKISLSQFQKGTGLDRTSVCRILKKLVACKPLVKTEKGYEFNKNWEQWVVAYKPPPVAYKPIGSGVQANRVVAYKPHTKETITKDTIQKKEETAPASPSLPQKNNKPPDSTPMNTKEFCDWCWKSPQRHIQIIGSWADLNEMRLNTLGQWRGYIKRNLRAARELEPYDDDQMQVGWSKLQKARQEGYLTKFTLETLIKYMI